MNIFIVMITDVSRLTKKIWQRSDVTTKVLECSLVVSGFELQSRYYVHFCINTFGKVMNPLISQAIS